MHLYDLTHTIDILDKKCTELTAHHDSLVGRVEQNKLKMAQNQVPMHDNDTWFENMKSTQLHIDDCIAYLRLAYQVTLNICNNFWVSLWGAENQMFELQNMLICFDYDLYYPFFSENSQFCKTDVANSNASKKMLQFERVLQVQLQIDEMLFKILDIEMKLVQTYACTDMDKELHESFKLQFKDLRDEMLEVQAKRIATFDCASMRPQYARFEHVKNQVKAMRNIVACVNIDCYRIY